MWFLIVAVSIGILASATASFLAGSYDYPTVVVTLVVAALIVWKYKPNPKGYVDGSDYDPGSRGDFGSDADCDVDVDFDCDTD